MSVEHAKQPQISVTSKTKSIISPDWSKNMNLGEVRRDYVRHWSGISANLPEDLDPHHKKFVRDYFRAELRIADGNRKKAGRIFDGLEKRKGYTDFEEANQPLLAAIDLAVTGKTNKKVEPLFVLD